MKKVLTLMFVALFVLSFAVAGVAADKPSQESGKKAYPAGPIQKAERGFSNAAFGWTEIPKRIVDKSKQTNPLTGLVVGTFQGTMKAFARTVSGVAEMVTFPIGGYEKPAVKPDMDIE